MNLCGNSLLQNDVENAWCEIDLDDVGLYLHAGVHERALHDEEAPAKEHHFDDTQQPQLPLRVQGLVFKI